MQEPQSQSDHTRTEHAKKLLADLARLSLTKQALFVLALFFFFVSSFIIITKLIDSQLVEIPRHGGQLVEGIIGRPRFINPIIAKSDADRDMSELIYSGLLRPTIGGDLIPDLAKDYSISEDGMTYTFTLRDDIVWHDGVAITSDDILFTIDKVRDSRLAIKSPRRASWEGVDVTAPDTKTVVFKLKQPYAPFLDSATMGILPKHIWQNVPDDEFDVSYYNIEPIGSGPYRVKGVMRDAGKGLPRYYDLIAFKRYTFGEPYITDLRIQFFGNNQEIEQAFSDHTIDQMHTLFPEEAKALETHGGVVSRTPLPRIFALYFNQNQQPIFTDKAVRKALDTAVNKDAIVAKVLGGYGKSIDSPLPFLPSVSTSTAKDTTGSSTDRILAAKAILEKAGWSLNTANLYEKTDKKKKTVTLLSFSIALPDVPELRSAAEMIKSDWQKIGADVTIKVFEQSNFASDVLSQRKYDILFYGQVISRVPDPYAYWHSSQRNAPGLNVALYTNKNVDKLIEDARKESDETARNTILSKFVSTVQDDTPAVFLYSPDFLYATSPSARDVNIGFMTTESERFIGIENWYIESERVWKWIAQRISRNT